MEQIVSDIFDDDMIPESDDELSHTQINLSLPARQISETSSETRSLFNGDFSDDDPTYHPEEQQWSPGSSPIDHNLITLQDLLGSKAFIGFPPVDISPQPGPSHQYKDINNVTGAKIASLILADVLNLVWDEVKTASRWRAVNPGNWKKNLTKNRRAKGYHI